MDFRVQIFIGGTNFKICFLFLYNRSCTSFVTSYIFVGFFQILAASVVQCLNEMEKDGFKSIAFPAFGTGKLGYPYYPVANTMCNVIHAYGKKNPRTKIESVYFFVYDKEELCKNVRKKNYTDSLKYLLIIMLIFLCYLFFLTVFQFFH